MITWQQLLLFVKTAFRVPKGSRREQAAFFVAALCFSGGVAPAKVAPDFISDKWITGLRIGLLAIGGIAFIYGAVRVWRLVNPRELPTVKDRPSVIKGPLAFTEADGELFRKLGRELELQKLLGLVLDNQVLMVVVRGASGAGKTSLLRAGLKHIVGARAIFHYWEALPSEPGKGLLRAIQETWPEGTAKPVTLADLINPSDALGRQSHVIVLDQFEQLRGNEKIFQLLRRIIRESKPPHRTTWVIAFRPEFSNDWLDFISLEQENGLRPPKDVSLKLFTAEQAREVIGQLINESDLKYSIEQSVIDNLVEAATVDGVVSPVDIGIGLLVLTELHERQSGETITKRDYQFAGGAEGLLTQYLSRCLELFPKESQEAILKAMLALRDPEENQQRLATGLTIDELAVEAGTDVRVLKLQLNRLADRDIRLLEADTPIDGSAVRYRLPHERLIPALYRMTGKLLAEVDQAKLRFQNAFQAWQTNDKGLRYLLKGKDLRLVQRYETQIPWGHDEQEKKDFLFRSRRRRHIIRTATTVLVIASIAAGWFSILQYQHRENRKYLTQSGYPVELYDDFQHRLKKLEMTEPLNLEYFTWLYSDSIEELSLTAAGSSNSIAGLTSLSRCRSLKKLTLNLGGSQVTDLRPLEHLKGLTQLSLILMFSQVRDLQPLAQLTGLTQLTLNLSGSQVSDLEPVAELKGLTQLTLSFGLSGVRTIRPIEQLKRLTQLSLDLSGIEVRDLQPLAQLKELTQLTLILPNNQMSDLKVLEQIKQLQLKLSVVLNSLSDLESLKQLKGLTQLTLDLSDSQASDLQPLAQLTGLTQLTLNVGRSQVSTLESLGQLTGLTQLTLYLNGSQVSDLQPLGQLKRLTQLTLYLNGSQVSDLHPLANLSKLTQLSLDLRYPKVSNLQPLANLFQLTQLSLDLSDTQGSNLELLATLSPLTRLSLDLGSSPVSDLEPLARFSQLTQLSLDLSYPHESNLELVRNLTRLQKLSIEKATRAQRMSLRNIPATLIELKF